VRDAVFDRPVERVAVAVGDVVRVDSLDALFERDSHSLRVALGLAVAIRFTVVASVALLVRDAVDERCRELFAVAFRNLVGLFRRDCIVEQDGRAVRVALGVSLAPRFAVI